MINLILEEEEARLLFIYASMGIATRNQDLDGLIDGALSIARQETKMGREDMEKLITKINRMYESLPCDDPNCTIHHPKENANPNPSDAGRATPE